MALASSSVLQDGIFEAASVSLWLEDFTGVAEEVDALRARGVTDIPAYIAHDPAFVARALRRIRVLRVNPASVRLFKARDEAELVASLERLFLPETYAAFEKELVALAHGQRNVEAETAMRDFQGGLVHVLMGIRFPPPGQPLDRVVVTLTDITDRVQAERDLRHSEERFRTMADNAPVMVWVTEPDGTCTFLNRSWYEFTGQTPEAGLGFGWLDAVHPDDRPIAHDVFVDANARQADFRVEYRLRRRDGEYRWAIDAAAPAFAKDGSYRGYVGSVIDISERRGLEDEMHRLQGAIAQAESFSNMVSHDLRAPLRAMNGLLHLVRTRHAAKLDADGQALLGQVTASATAMAGIVDGILGLSQVTKGGIHPKSLDLSAIARDVAGPFGPQHPATVLDVAPGLSAHADANLARILLANLIGNAYKFSAGQPRPRVQVGRGVHKGMPMFFVRDNGVGIDPGDAARLFRPFERLRPTEFEGTGLGLAIVARVIEAHRSIIAVDSAPGVGTTVWFTLEPLVQPGPGPAATAPA